ncbi:hypothetical protein Nepgr_004043 [Nepenthes gracilis]|uniref:Uncharacterized protein n=1 Tax=Nepenthes gracilis TaxID=150966 RepID=A0AAD3XEJ4_NEPGR|nr:hypothetical protein Nepgr_004043 [Nepenthes gracilis]
MAPVHYQSSHPSPIDNPHSPKPFLSSDLIPVSTRPVSDFSYMGVIPESPSPPSLHSEFARSSLLAELPVSVDVECAPQKSEGFSIPCSVDMVPDGLGNCMASPSKFQVGSLPVNPGPTIVGELDASVLPLGSSSPPRMNMPCTSSVMSPVYSASSIRPASYDALPFCSEVPKNSPVTTHPCGADAVNKAIVFPPRTQSGLSLNKIGKDYDGIEAHHVSNSASRTDVVSGPDFCPIQHPPNSGHQGLASPNNSLNLEPLSDGSDSSGSASKSKKRGSKSSKKFSNSKGPKSSTPLGPVSHE